MGPEAIDQAKVAIRMAEPVVTSLYLEPDSYPEPNIYFEICTPAPRPERPSAPSH